MNNELIQEIKQCLDLLSKDGINSKRQVYERLIKLLEKLERKEETK